MKRARGKRRQPGEMNSGEKAYALRLWTQERAFEILDYKFEPVALRIGARCTYTPDFMVIAADGQVEFHEVKAWWKPSKTKLMTDKNAKGKVGWMEDARVKIKTAAAQFPFFRFFAVWQMPDGTWEKEEFDP